MRGAGRGPIVFKYRQMFNFYRRELDHNPGRCYNGDDAASMHSDGGL